MEATGSGDKCQAGEILTLQVIGRSVRVKNLQLEFWSVDGVSALKIVAVDSSLPLFRFSFTVVSG